MPLEKDLAEGEKWVFDESVAKSFEEMLARSIPQYDVMRATVGAIAGDFMCRTPGPVVDLGSSRGDALAPLVASANGAREFYAVECAAPMRAVLADRFRDEIAGRRFHVVEQDLREARDMRAAWGLNCSVILSVLTLQFVPINHRQAIVTEVYRRLAPGGAFILVEKVLGESALVDELMVSHYHGLKGHNGYSRDEIERKSHSLEGVLVPVTARWNVELLRQAGFRHVDCVWRWMNFAAWVAVRD